MANLTVTLVDGLTKACPITQPFFGKRKKEMNRPMIFEENN